MKLLLLSAIPAKALYQAKKAPSRAKSPPAFINFSFGAPSTLKRYPRESKRMAMSTKKKREKNAKVDLRVSIVIIVVKMNQPY